MSQTSQPPLADRVAGLFPSSEHDGASPRVNVGDSERMGSAAAGCGLFLLGLGTRRLPGLLMMLGGAGLVYRGLTGHCAVYERLGISRFANSARGVRAGHGFEYETELVIERPPEELYNYWRKLENLPLVMRHLISVTDHGGGRSRWVARGPM